MGNANTNVAKIQQSVTNNILQYSGSTCSFSDQSSLSGNIAVFGSVRTRGDFTGQNLQTLGTDSTCVLTSSMASSVSNILASIIQQSNNAQTDWFNGFSVTANTNTYNLQQSMNNQINQINQSTCSSNTVTSANNNYVFVGNIEAGGNVVGQNISVGQAAASCNLTNTMKNVTYNTGQSQGNQNNKSRGMFTGMFSSFLTMIVLIVILVVILFTVGAIGYIGYEAVEGHSSTPSPSPDDAVIAAVASAVAPAPAVPMSAPIPTAFAPVPMSAPIPIASAPTSAPIPTTSFSDYIPSAATIQQASDLSSQVKSSLSGFNSYFSGTGKRALSTAQAYAPEAESFAQEAETLI